MICAKRLRQNVPSSTEAAIGSVDKKQMETLMAHGLSPEEAVDVTLGVARYPNGIPEVKVERQS
jgi:hypothetical protein